MQFRTSLAAVLVLGAAVGLLTFAVVRSQPVEGGPDPSTPYGQSVIQNQQYEQHEQQREQQWNQQNQEQQERDQRFQEEQRQFYGQPGDNGGPDVASGPFGAIYFDPTHPATSRTSYNYPSPHAAEAAARGACSQAAGHLCREALEFHDTCAALAHSRNGPWAARAASSPALARDMAIDACQKAGGQVCASKNAYCSPNND